jgi:hypothetical protein
MGSTDESGNFILTTYDENDGAMPGTHVVTVKKIADESSAPGTAGPPAADSSAVAQSIERAMQETALKARAAEKARSLLPAKYAHHDTSDLRLEVVEGPNHFEIELKD